MKFGLVVCRVWSPSNIRSVKRLEGDFVVVIDANLETILLSPSSFGQ